MDIEDEIRFAPFSSYEQSEKEERDPPGEITLPPPREFFLMLTLLDTTLIGNISNIGVAFSSSGTRYSWGSNLDLSLGMHFRREMSTHQLTATLLATRSTRRIAN